MEYKATLDLKSKIITAFVGLLFLAITFRNAKFIGESKGHTVLILSSILIFSILIFCYLFMPLKYIIDKNKLIIKRPFKDLVIDLKNIKDTFLPTKESMRWTIRTFGNGGLFGYIGKFSNKTHGTMTWYATKTSNYLILVTNDNKKIVLTPDNTEMIHEIKKLSN